VILCFVCGVNSRAVIPYKKYLMPYAIHDVQCVQCVVDVLLQIHYVQCNDFGITFCLCAFIVFLLLS